MQIYAYVALNFMLNLRNYANYAVCSHSAIMPESNAGIIGLAQMPCVFFDVPPRVSG